MRRRRAFEWLGTAVLMLLCSELTSAQQPSCVETVHVNAFTRDGRLVVGLDQSKFVASYKHRSVPICSVEENRSPRRVFILIDASGSMLPLHDLSFKVAQALLDDFPPATKVAFLVFAERATGAPEFTTDRNALRNQLETVRNERRLQRHIRRMTALFNTVNESLSFFGDSGEGDSLYIISDGGDNASGVNWRKLDREIVERGIRVFAMRIHWTGNQAVPEAEGNHLQDLVNSTGGYEIVLPVDIERYQNLVYDPPLEDARGKPTLLGAAVILQVRLIAHTTDMLVQLPQTSRKLINWDLRFTGQQDAKDIILTYQHLLPPCGK